MKTLLVVLSLVIGFGAAAQLKMKTVEKPDGSYTYCYHSNGKESTVEFRPKSGAYGAEGYSKAYDKTGKLIYEATSSRSGVLSGTYFTYYENGAIKSAEYSSHPDAGIQWYRKTTYFDEAGNKTGEFEQSHDDRVTIMMPDTSYQRLEKEHRQLEEQRRIEKAKLERKEFVKDSSAFYITSKETLEDGSTIEYIPDAANGKREIVVSKSGKVIKTTTEHKDKSKGIHTIVRTYYKNGRIETEWSYEPVLFHYRKYNKKGILIEEVLNQK